MSDLADRRSDIWIGRFDHRTSDLDARAFPESLLRARQASPNRAVLLIHGWSVPVERQAESYDPLLRLIDGRHPPAADAILTVSWSSTGAYWQRVRETPAVAEALAAFLCAEKNGFTRRQELVLIGHSMGCRVALELLAMLKARAFVPEIRLFLMAAAVPVTFVQTGRLAEAADAAAHSVVYYSPEDIALGLPFRLGQTIADDGGLMPEAVGLWGRPERGVWKDRKLMVGFDHGHYWRADDVALDLVNDHLRRAQRQMGTRDMPQRGAPQR